MYSKEDNHILAIEVAQFAHDPLGYVLFSFPWGVEGTALEDYSGPDVWQRKLLNGIGERLKSDKKADSMMAIRKAISSGHGVGKSCLVAWLVLWAMNTHEDTKVVVTANTEAQLKDKTWAEVQKWHSLCNHKNWLKFTATALYSEEFEKDKVWRATMVPWSIHKTEAFAGLHNKDKRILIIFDEASAIPPQIWEVTEGALTDANTEIIWCCFGNPTRNTGQFRDVFGRFKNIWDGQRVDSRDALMSNKKQIEEWKEAHGENSDFFRVRVRGEFPNAAFNQFIASDIAEKARGKHINSSEYTHAARVMGVDVARFGDDETVFAYRQGLASFPQSKFRGLDTQAIALLAKQEYEVQNMDAMMIDGIGVGAGVVDKLRMLGGMRIIDAQVGMKAINDKKYVNRRIEVWDKMKQWLIAGGAIPDDSDLVDQLIGPEYFFSLSDKMQLESKKDMKARGLASPDRADALSLTFYTSVQGNTGSNNGSTFFANKRN